MHSARTQVWDEGDCRRVHEATLTVLADAGVVVNHERARTLLAQAGAAVEGTRVRIPVALVEQALASAPRSWPLRSRGRDTVLDLVDGATYYGTGPDCLYTQDAGDGRRRRTRLADVEALAALCETLPNIDFVMSMGLPEDVADAVVDLEQFAAMLAGTCKPLIVSSPHPGSSLRVMREMAALCGEAESFACLTMASPPLKHDREALDKLLVCAELLIPVVLAPAPGAGTTAPSSVTATVVVGNAEVLSGLVIHQLARPGAPFVYGSGVSVMNMSTAVDTYCAPECFLGNQATCDLTRSYGLPSWSYAACSDSKVLDGQQAAEAALTALLGTLSRATLLHDVGYFESGLQSSGESIILGDELVGYAKAFMKPVPTDDEALAIDEIVAVGPGGNHLARPYTRAHHREFWRPGLLDQAVYDRWSASGGLSLGERVKARGAELRAAPRAVSLDDRVRRELAGMIARAAGR